MHPHMCTPAYTLYKCTFTCCGKLVLFTKRMRIELVYNSAIPVGLCPPSYEKQGLANNQYIPFLFIVTKIWLQLTCSGMDAYIVTI